MNEGRAFFSHGFFHTRKACTCTPRTPCKCGGEVHHENGYFECIKCGRARNGHAPGKALLKKHQSKVVVVL